MAWGLSLMAIPLAATGVKNYLSGIFMFGGVNQEVERIVGYAAPLTRNPNDLALMLNLVLPLSLALFMVNRRPVVRMILAAIIALDIIGVIVTFSRAGFLTLTTILLMYQWKFRKGSRRGWAVGVLVIALVCIPLVPSGYWDHLSTITHSEGDPTGSAEARWRDAVVAVSFVIRNPILGAGVGMDVLALNQERGAVWRSVHNVYLQYAMDLGIPGLVLFLLLLVGCIKCATFVQRRCARLPALRELFYFAEAIEVSLIAFSVAALFHPVAYHFYFYYIAGLAVGIKAVHEATSRSAIGR